MNIKLLSVETDDEEFGPYLRFEIPEAKFNGFIDIEDFYSECDGYYEDDNFLKNNNDALIEIVEDWINDNGFTRFNIGTLPKWSDIPESVADYIYSFRFQMNFINTEEMINYGEEKELEKYVNDFSKALVQYPALSDVISLYELEVSIMENGDAVITFGSAACYVNWFGYEE